MKKATKDFNQFFKLEITAISQINIYSQQELEKKAYILPSQLKKFAPAIASAKISFFSFN